MEIFKKCALFLAIFTLTSNSAHAYFDPAVGSAIATAFGSVFVGAIFYYNKIKIFLKSKSKKIADNFIKNRN